MQRHRALVPAVLMAAGFAPPASALPSELPKVAIVAAAAASGTGDCRFTDVRDKLVASGQFSAVDVFDTTAAIPALATLLEYDACLCWTNLTRTDYVLWGDTMADYVDSGGGVVVAVYANSSTTAARHLGGRWITGGYEVIISQSGNQLGLATLGNVLDPAHPIMQGVASFDGGSSSARPVGTALEAGSSLIAEWSDGKVLVAVGANPRRADLGMYPPSDDCSNSFWDSTTDGALLMANALTFVARPAVETYCTAKTGLVCGRASISSSGASSASASSGFTVRSAPARQNRSGLVLYSDAGRAAFPFQGGTLCVNPAPLLRTVSVSSGGATPCGGVFLIDMNSFAAGALGGNPDPFLVVPGTRVNTQWWGRDSVATGSLLSDGLEYCVGS